MEGCCQYIVDDDAWSEFAGLARGEEAAIDSHLLLEADRFLVCSEITWIRDDEQVADLVEVNRPARTLVELLECRETAGTERDVHRI